MIHHHLTRDAQDVYEQRVCLMREGNNIPAQAPTPAEIEAVALQEAEAFMAEARRDPRSDQQPTLF